MVSVRYLEAFSAEMTVFFFCSGALVAGETKVSALFCLSLFVYDVFMGFMSSVGAL